MTDKLLDQYLELRAVLDCNDLPLTIHEVDETFLVFKAKHLELMINP